MAKPNLNALYRASPGKFPDISNKAYHAAQDALTSSDIKMLHPKYSMEKWKYYWEHKIKNKQKDIPVSFSFGSLVHGFIEGLNVEDLVIICPTDTRRTKKGKQLWAIYWKQIEETGKIPINLDNCVLSKTGNITYTNKDLNIDRARGMANNVIKFLDIQSYWKGIKRHEMTIYGNDPNTGLLLKCRPDIFYPEAGVILDIKTTKSFFEDSFKRDIEMYEYDIQAAYYIHVCKLAGYDIRRFIFLALDKTDDCHDFKLYDSEEFLSGGSYKMNERLTKLHEAIDLKSFKPHSKHVRKLYPSQFYNSRE